MSKTDIGEGTTRAATTSWRKSNWVVLVEFILIALIFYADYRKVIPVSKTPELVLLAWASLRLRGLRWRDVGLRRPNSWTRTLIIGAVLGALLETFQLTVTQPILAGLIGRHPDLELFRAVTGNLKLTLLLVLLSWTLAAFGEEMVWRGYLMSRVADLGNSKRASWVASLIGVSIVFGLSHGYQGLTGWIEEGLAGLALGLIYLGTGRNLWAAIIAHGVSNTIDMILIYFGKMPGL